MLGKYLITNSNTSSSPTTNTSTNTINRNLYLIGNLQIYTNVIEPKAIAHK